MYVQGRDSASQNSKGPFKSSKDLKWGGLGIQVLPLAPTLDQALIHRMAPFFWVLSLHVTPLEKIHSVFGGCLTRQNLMYRITVSGPYCYSQPLFS